MSGPDNIRGIDYQVWCSLLLVLTSLTEGEAGFTHLQVESLDDEGEDLAFESDHGRRVQVQIKKMVEGYNWTPATLRSTLIRFASYPATTESLFLSDGSASRQLLPLKKFLEGETELDADISASVCDETFSVTQLQSLAGRVRIQTRHFPSPIEADPAARVRMEVERLIASGRFSVVSRPAETASRLWETLFAAAREGSLLSRTDLVREFANAGLRPVQSHWAVYPIADKYYEHEYPVARASELLRNGGLVSVTGIGGSGKSTFLAEAASVAAQSGCHACWITLTELVEPEDFVSILGDYCASNKLEIAAERLRTAERVTWAKIVAEIIQRFPVAVVIDRLDAASTRTSALIETIASAVASFASGGSLALTGREQPLWWNDVARNAPRATSVSLAGLSPPAAISMLADSGIGADDNERAGLVRAVGAHAQSLVLLRQARTAENAEIQNMGVEAAKDWLLRRVLDGLPERERESLARLSIFSYAAPLDLAYAVLDPLGRDNVRALQRKEFVRIELDTVVIHDAVRSAASDFIGDSTVRACHQAAADHLFESIVDEFEKTEFVAFEKSIPWAMHLQAWHGGEPAPDRFSLILAASDEHLLGLFAISKLGFPFAFGDADWTHALRVLEDLEEDGLIDENHKKPKKKKNLDEPIFSLVGFSFYDKLLITSLCYYRGLADNLGYIDDMRPNYTFAQQGLACPWEHCIELSPLPMISRSDWEAGLEEDRHRLANPELYQLTDQHKQVLTARVSGGVPDWVTETVDEELAARSCPIFGHGCPGGRTQAETCRKKGRFVWATRPSKSK